jgi:hypothetical protein
VTAASDIFSQDYEDLPEELRGENGAPIQKRGTKKQAAPSNEICTPNYGPEPNVPLSQVSDKHLQGYYEGAERAIKDPKKANFLQKNEAMRDALKAELVKREAAKQPATPSEQGGEPTVTPQQLAERMEMAESVAELSGVMNTAVATEMSDADRATLKGVFDVHLARLGKGKK